MTSTDLHTWTADAGAIQTPGTAVGGIETVEVTVTAPEVNGKRFVRVAAQ